MKLTKQKLEQLIMEEYKSMNRQIFDKRRNYPNGGTIRALGDEGQPFDPEYADTLTTLGSSGPEGFNQAIDLADTLDEPLDIEFDPTDMQTFRAKRKAPIQMHYDNWYNYVMSGYASDFENPINPKQFDRYVRDKGIQKKDEVEEAYEKLNTERLRYLQKMYIKQPKTEYEKQREIEKILDVDLRPDWMKKSHYN